LPTCPSPPAPQRGSRRSPKRPCATEVNDVKIELNEEVLSCIDLLPGAAARLVLRSGWPAAGATCLASGRSPLGRHPQDLAYVALVESAFKDGALSRTKAKGVWQFMPATGSASG